MPNKIGQIYLHNIMYSAWISQNQTDIILKPFLIRIKHFLGWYWREILTILNNIANFTILLSAIVMKITYASSF